MAPGNRGASTTPRKKLLISSIDDVEGRETYRTAKRPWWFDTPHVAAETPDQTMAIKQR
jgi:hypothetical protein